MSLLYLYLIYFNKLYYIFIMKINVKNNSYELTYQSIPKYEFIILKFKYCNMPGTQHYWLRHVLPNYMMRFSLVLACLINGDGEIMLNHIT